MEGVRGRQDGGGGLGTGIQWAGQKKRRKGEDGIRGRGGDREQVGVSLVACYLALEGGLGL